MPRQNLVEHRVCPFCDQDVGQAKIAISPGGQNLTVNCPCCGEYEISGTAAEVVPNWDLTESQLAAIAFAVRRMTDRPIRPALTTYLLEQVRDTAKLPAPETLVDELVVWLGKRSDFPGQPFQITYPEFRAVLGVANVDAFNFATEWIGESGWFLGMRSQSIGPGPLPVIECRLSPAGWERYSMLTRSRTEARYGFMAMKYNDDELDAIVNDHFRPEVQRTGFDLRRLDDGQPAGLIDDQLRVRIRTARFLVCDLTHGNKGAYWEAGFAEGLGKPVIYTCRRDVFEDRQHEQHPHFDTNHMVTIVWDPADPAAAAQKLKATIRATLPAEALLTD